MSEEKKKDELVVEHSKIVDTSIQLIDIEPKQVVGNDGGSKPDIFIDNGTGYTNRKI